MFKRQFDNMTKDVGKELKDAARGIYIVANWSFIVFAIIELIAVICVVIEDDELMALLVLFPIALAIEYGIFSSIIHLITIRLYAKGEIVHLLRSISLQPRLKSQDQPQLQNVAKEPTAQKIQAVPERNAEKREKLASVNGDVWVCKNCGTSNKQVYGQCKKCGVNRGSTAPIESVNIIEPQPAGTTKVEKEEKINRITEVKNNLAEKTAAVTQKVQTAIGKMIPESPGMTPTQDGWICSKCGTKNKNQYGQCKQCGTYRS